MAYITFQPKDNFKALTYTGTGSSNAITGVGFQPDWTWIKNRSANDGHHIYDVVRGVTKRIRSDTTAAEATTAQGLTAFGTDGFTVGTEEDVNTNSENFISWNWKAGNSAGSSNSDGSITSTVSANTTSGFSIVKWTGTGSDGTVGHGLGAVPEMAIIKSLGNTTYWMVYHKRLGNAAEIYLNADNAENTGAATWNTTTPTSTTISLDGGSGNGVNYSGDYIGYFFTSKKGFCKVGDYDGNGSTDGPFVYTGFKPAFILLKNKTTAGEWWIINDNARSPNNVVNKDLFPNNNNAEASHDRMDFVSNGFKLRSTANNSNKSSASFIYVAFAEEPIVSSNNIPATAR